MNSKKVRKSFASQAIIIEPEKGKLKKSQNEKTLKVYADVVKLLSVLSCSDLSLVHLAHFLSFMILIN